MAKHKPAHNYRIEVDEEELVLAAELLKMKSAQKSSALKIPKITIKHRNKNQDDFTKLIEDNEIILCSGPAGVGKSYLSIAKALELLFRTDTPYNKINLITPAVESEEKLGFLPGDLFDKLQPYLYSTYYLIDKLIGKDNRIKLVTNGTIEPIAVGFLRGMNVDNTVLIFEEAQNSSTTTMKTLLTRIGYNSKFIISGDLEQIDNEKLKYRKNSGLQYAIENLAGIDNIGLFKFNQDDIVRNKLIGKILDSFDKLLLPKE
jgi:phosphate starvation-inducible PhoH-like protein